MMGWRTGGGADINQTGRMKEHAVQRELHGHYPYGGTHRASIRHREKASVV